MAKQGFWRGASNSRLRNAITNQCTRQEPAPSLGCPGSLLSLNFNFVPGLLASWLLPVISNVLYLPNLVTITHTVITPRDTVLWYFCQLSLAYKPSAFVTSFTFWYRTSRFSRLADFGGRFSCTPSKNHVLHLCTSHNSSHSLLISTRVCFVLFPKFNQSLNRFSSTRTQFIKKTPALLPDCNCRGFTLLLSYGAGWSPGSFSLASSCHCAAL